MRYLGGYYSGFIITNISKILILDIFLTKKSVLSIVLSIFANTGGPRYMREIGTPKIGSHVMNLHMKRPRITIN